MEANMNFDNEVLAYLSTRKDELMQQHDQYITAHPEIREVLNDFLSAVLLSKPVSLNQLSFSSFPFLCLQDDVFVYAKEYFHPFNPTPLKNKPLILVGPSGVGKRTLIDLVLREYGDIFDRKRSYTTRPVRDGNEKASENFHFTSPDEFARMAAAKEFIECREKSPGCWYGTTYAELERIKSAGKIPIIEVDVDGAIEINKQALEGNFLFIYPPSFEELRRRIGNRIETEQEFKIRIREAIRQIEMANNSVLFTNRLVNDTLDDAKDQFFTLIKALYFQEIASVRGTAANINSSR